MDTELTNFSEWFKSHRNGRADDEVTAVLSEAVQVCRSLEKPATVTLTIKVSPSGGGRQVVVVDEIKAKIPEPDREVAIFYVDNLGNLTRDDPLQERLPFEPASSEEPGVIHLHRDTNQPKED